MTDDQPQPTDPAALQPAPVPTGVKVATVRNVTGEAMVLLQVQTPAGIGYYFLDPEVAVQVGNALRGEGKAGISRKPRLSTPPGLLVPGR